MFRVLHFLPSSLLLPFPFSFFTSLYLLGILDRGNSPFHNASTFSLFVFFFRETQVQATHRKVSVFHLLIRSFKGSSSQIGNYFRSSQSSSPKCLLWLCPAQIETLFSFTSFRVWESVSLFRLHHPIFPVILQKLVLFFSVRLSLRRFSIIVRLPL